MVEDSTRVMLRLKAMFGPGASRHRASGYPSQGPAGSWPSFSDDGARFRAQTLYAQLDVLRELRAKAKAAMVAEARGIRRGRCWEASRTWGRFGYGP